MKGFWKYFWVIYILFFAIPFPLFIYYMTVYKLVEVDTNPWLAMIYLALSVLLWSILLVGWFRKWVVMPFIVQKNISRLLTAGVSKESRIIKSQPLMSSGNGFDTKEIVCSLKNFVGTDITEKLVVNDSQPVLRRYEEGKTIQLRIDPALKAIPPIIPDGVKVSMKTGRILLLFFVWLAVAAAVAGYYCYAYTLENSGLGWRFLRFYHPLIIIPLILLSTRWGLMKLLSFIGGSPAALLRFKYYGIRTDARIVSASQTGTYINEQPQLRFELQYQDTAGVSHNASLKKIIPLLELEIAKQATIPVFYLKDKPEQIAFASDVEA
ncbi:hypothetical protein [Chitinophaga sp.]|uniref:hypothetical protein n=1 Tax=Chitinophaga sp. TaxID=1869181 RepID=UPI002F94ED70